MEKQTIGQFMSALRRSNGYTQQEVAEKLGVSNKTVSCWERDAYLPDISTIPAIAELYGVTCDEILRAKRAPAIPENGTSDESDKTRLYAEKAEKEASAIFDNMVARYENTQKIAVACAVFVCVVALILAAVVGNVTGVSVYSFVTAVPILVTDLFVLLVINYRLDFSLSSDERTMPARKRMYRRKNIIAGLLIVCAAYFIPFVFETNYDFKKYLFGIATAVTAFMLLVLAELVRRLVKPQYYKPVPKRTAATRIAVYSCLFATALASLFGYGVSLNGENFYYPPLSETVYRCENAQDLISSLQTRTLPECYEEISASVGGQFERRTYTVDAKDFNIYDVMPFPSYYVTSYDDGRTYCVDILYPIFSVELADPADEAGSSVRTEVTVLNENYQTSNIKVNSGGSYEIVTERRFEYQRFSSKINDQTDYKKLTFGAVAAAVALAVFGAYYAASAYYVKKHDNKHGREIISNKENENRV